MRQMWAFPEGETAMTLRKRQSDQMPPYNAHSLYPPPLRQSPLLVTITTTIAIMNQNAHTTTKTCYLCYSSFPILANIPMFARRSTNLTQVSRLSDPKQAYYAHEAREFL